MKYIYKVTKESHWHSDIGYYVSYGIYVDYTINSKANHIFISDVSVDYEKVKRLAEHCTVHQLEPCHLKEVIEDFLNSKHI